MMLQQLRFLLLLLNKGNLLFIQSGKINFPCFVWLDIIHCLQAVPLQFYLLIVTGFGKTDHNVTFCISRNTVLKHGSRCGSPVLHYSHARFAV